MGEQEELLSGKQRQLEKQDENCKKLQSNFPSQQHDQQRNENKICSVTNQIKEQKQFLHEKQTVINDFKSEVSRKESVLTNIEQECKYRKETFSNNEATLRDNRRKLSINDIRKKALVAEIKRKTKVNENLQFLDQKKKLQVEITDKNLNEVTIKCKKHERIINILEKTKINTIHQCETLSLSLKLKRINNEKP